MMISNSKKMLDIDFILNGNYLVTITALHHVFQYQYPITI
jgi:hypothetical protein